MGTLSSIITPTGLVTLSQLQGWKPATATLADSALEAKTLSTNRTNWATNGTISAVVGQLAWRNFSNNHTIFDASAGLAPDGTTVDRTNSTHGWTATYPTLMGWNGATTFGVRVESARHSDYSNSASGVWVSAPISSGVSGGDTTRSAEIVNNGGAGDTNVAALAFHCNGYYRLKLYLRADGAFGLGGDSRAAWSWYSDGVGNMVAAGNVTAYSDPRLKENFEKVQDALGILAKLDGGTFNWKKNIPHIACKAGKRDYGVLADQVEAVMPEIVTESIEIEGQSYKTVSYEKLVPVLIEAVKHLDSRVKELEES